MSQHQQHADSAIELVTKAAPPVSVSLATIAGFQVSEVVLWLTLIYTILMILHKVISIYKEFKRGEK